MLRHGMSWCGADGGRISAPGVGQARDELPMVGHPCDTTLQRHIYILTTYDFAFINYHLCPSSSPDDKALNRGNNILVTKGSPQGDTMSLFCEARVGRSRSKFCFINSNSPFC